MKIRFNRKLIAAMLVAGMGLTLFSGCRSIQDANVNNYDVSSAIEEAQKRKSTDRKKGM